MGGEVKSGADMEGNPSNNFKKLHRRIKQDFKVSTNKDIISLERLKAANLVIFAGPREMFSSDEFTAIKDYLSEGGSILFLVGEGGEGKSNTNVNYLLEEFGMSGVASVLPCLALLCRTRSANSAWQHIKFIKAGFKVPNDRTIVDVSGFARHEHQHFFNETVCYTFDLFPGEGVMLPSQWQWKHLASHGQLFRNDKEEDKDDDEEEEKPPENRSDDINATEKSIMMKKEIKKLIFLRVQQIAGKHCTVWQLNESRTMRMGRLVEAGDGTEGCSELVNASCKAGEWASLFLRHSLGDRPSIQLQSLLTQRAGLGRGLATMTAIFDFCVTEQGELLSTEALYKLTYQRKADETHNETRRTCLTAVDAASCCSTIKVSTLLMKFERSNFPTSDCLESYVPWGLHWNSFSNFLL
eukprot:g9253.t1